MNRRLPGLTALCAGLCWGCVRIPFECVPQVSMAGVDVAQVRARALLFQHERYTLLNSIVFKFHGRAMSTLGYASVDTENGSFTVVALTPIGLRLFELTRRGEELTVEHLVPDLAHYGDLPRAVADDVSRIYLGCVPSSTARVRRLKHAVVFTEQTDEGTLEHTYGGPKIVLVRKTFRDRRGIVWSASYHDYREHKGRVYPQGIYLRHHRHRYQLIVRLKEICEP